LKSGAAVAHNNLGLALTSKGELAEAADSFREALRIQPDFAEAHVNLAVALEYLERSAEALKHVETALLIRPTFAVAHLNRAINWPTTGDSRWGSAGRAV